MAGERTNGHVRGTKPGSENPSGEMCTEGSSSEPAADEQEEKPPWGRAARGRGGAGVSRGGPIPELLLAGNERGGVLPIVAPMDGVAGPPPCVDVPDHPSE